MPSAHRNALKTLLTSIEKRIGEDEVRLLKAANDEERAKLVEELTDLQVRLKELKDLLLGDGECR
jgi:hypothetical protein